jgi:hypothetical protein
VSFVKHPLFSQEYAGKEYPPRNGTREFRVAEGYRN